jgi:hypothetical protein
MNFSFAYFWNSSSALPFFLLLALVLLSKIAFSTGCAKSRRPKKQLLKPTKPSEAMGATVSKEQTKDETISVSANTAIEKSVKSQTESTCPICCASTVTIDKSSKKSFTCSCSCSHSHLSTVSESVYNRESSGKEAK